MAIPETTMKQFKHLAKVAEIVFVIPRSNAEQERLFTKKQKRFLLCRIICPILQMET